MSKMKIEEKIRTFFVEDMVKENVRDAGADDELDLDSLDQTELRVFLEEEFGIKFNDLTEIDPFVTLQGIIDFVQQHSRLAIS